MRYQLQVVAVVISVIIFIVVLPFIWQDEESVKSKQTQKQVEALVPTQEESPIEEWRTLSISNPSLVRLPSLDYEPFLSYPEYATPFQELKKKDLNKIKVSFAIKYDPFGFELFAQPLQSFVSGGSNGAGNGGGSAGGGFPALSVPVSVIGAGSGVSGAGNASTDNGGTGGGNTGGGGVVGDPPLVFVPEPATYLLLATLLAAVKISQKHQDSKTTASSVDLESPPNTSSLMG